VKAVASRHTRIDPECSGMGDGSLLEQGAVDMKCHPSEESYSMAHQRTRPSQQGRETESGGAGQPTTNISWPQTARYALMRLADGVAWCMPLIAAWALRH
jgi:hypothetical protein